MTAKLRKNDLTSVEDMLFGQAVALQSLFVRLSEGALQAETIPNYDLKFRYALRAQSQCRATLETLANIKNPPSVMFARQANLANGPQQINNGVPAPARADGSDSKQIEQSEAQHELRQDTRTPALTLGDDQAMAPVGPVDGTANSARQGDVIAKRLEGRQPTGPSRPRANAARPATAA
jgi:hypothetical protein